MQKPATFQVYNASAGSGKTFTLVKEYLKILLSSEDIFTFQKVLAITFTNKAAGEMKERVLLNLQQFAEGEENDLLSLVLQETALDKITVQERSKKIIDAILQNYSAFSITTIDSFTHKIIKSFAYDLGLPLSFEVEMDAATLLSEAVDMLISKIGVDKEITELLIDFSLDKADDDKSWDIVQELTEFARILLNEDDSQHFRKIADKSIGDFVALKEKLQKHQGFIKTRLLEIGAQGVQSIANANIAHNDFYRSMLPNHFVALSKKPETAKFFEDSKLRERIEEQTFYAKSKSEAVKSAIESVLPELLELYLESEELYRQFLFNKLALKSLIPLAVLNHVNNELIQIKEDNNLRLNAEFNQLISTHIKDQPAPFIYERLGQRFMHYFIDEMQDTSVLQWQNLIPLIGNALAQENSGLLVVGDGKQAIYRWRGGKAEQFIELGLPAASGNPFHIAKEVKELDTNYRSYSEIIAFNNQFFQYAAQFLQNDDYKELFITGNKQLENAKKGGCVSLSFLDKVEDKEEDALKYPKKVLEKIQELQQEFLLGEICVLVRKKADGIAVANYLSAHGIDIISSETLLLSNSRKVNFIIQLLQVIQHPKDKETLLEMLYFLYDHIQVAAAKHEFLSKHIHLSLEDIFTHLEAYGVTFVFNDFQQLSFYEKIEELIRSFHLITEGSDAYVQFFLDEVLEQQRKGTTIQEFLDFWEAKKANLSIVAPEGADAVQIMTIHKSKGLEFPVVIFPYDLDIYRQIKPKVWLDELPEKFEPFDKLLVPFGKELNYINDRATTIYTTQREALELDNFNLLYVALTRAVEQLHVITAHKVSAKGVENTNHYSGIFISYLKNKEYWDSEQLTYSFGEFKRKSELVPQKSSVELQKSFYTSGWKTHQITMLASASKLWDTEQEEAITYGNLIHEIMAKIHTINDIAQVVQVYEQQGSISKAARVLVETQLNKIVTHPMLASYFSVGIKNYNEREIVTPDQRIVIPDRLAYTNKGVVIIDYKTGKPHPKYKQQLQVYEDALRAMHLEVAQKLLVYIDDTILVEEID